MADPKDQPVDFDDLLASVEPETEKNLEEGSGDDLLADLTADEPSEAPAPSSATPAPAAPSTEETAEQKRIRELEAQLSAPLPQGVEEDTPEQARIKELEDQLAKRNALIMDRAPETYTEDSGPGEKILIHFLEDGFSAFGQIWSKGQEIEVVVGSPSWKRTVNRNGKSWLDLRNNPTAQRLKFGKIMFGEGPYVWREGEEFDVAVAQADVRRGRRVPVSAAG